ncbi:hypothetical protein [Emticicia fontis]
MLCLFGRRTGKTSGVGVTKQVTFMKEMPKSRMFWGNPSYTNLYRNTLPEILNNLQNRFKLTEGVHFVFREKPPQGFERAYRPSTDYKNTLFLANGSECNFFSLNFNVINNGDAVDAGILDETRFMSQEIVNNLLLCLSGTHHSFSKNPYHKSLLMMTDMPTHEDGDWLFDYEENMDEEIIQDIIECHHFWQQYRVKLKEDLSPSYRYEIEKKVAFYQEHLCKLSNLTTAVIKASTLDNIHVLGFDTIDNYMKLFDTAEFSRSVLNERQGKTKENFYFDLSEQVHGYTAPKTSFISNLAVLDGEQDCRWDADIDPKLNLKLGFDWNSAITSLNISQLDMKKMEFNFKKSLYVEKPLKRKHLIQKFARYFGPLKGKIEIDFYYDATATFTDADKTVDESYAYKTLEELQAFGFKVNMFFIEKQVSHKWIFERWGELLRGELGIRFGYNLDNCSEWAYACSRTKTKTRILENGRRKLEKDKGSEHINSKIKPIHATHITEAGDTLLKGVLLIDLQFSEDNIETEYMQAIVS